MFECRTPKSQQEFDQYYHLRWKILRKPLDQIQGSEKDELEGQSVHRAIFDVKGMLLPLLDFILVECLAHKYGIWQSLITFRGKD